MRRIIIIAAVGLLLGVGSQPAQASFRGEVARSARAACDALVKRDGAEARGRDIVRWGVVTKRGTRPATLAELRDHRGVCKRALAPPVVVASVAGSYYSGPVAPGVSGRYCGLFQFDDSTWRSVGGSGSACGAPVAEQWARARELQRQRGNQPWPVCGRGGASLEAIVQCESSGDPSARG